MCLTPLHGTRVGRNRLRALLEIGRGQEYHLFIAEEFSCSFGRWPEMQCEVKWNAPRWDPIACRKHFKPSAQSRRNWNRSVLTLYTRNGGAAVFDPNLKLGQIEAMGMSCLQVVDGNVEAAHGVVEFHGPVCHIRRFYRRFDFVVGACDGEQTNYLFVEYVNMVSVHGWPASVNCLRRKGANV